MTTKDQPLRVLVVKTSSLGDVLHTLPAITDAGKALEHIRFDWVVEEVFQEIPHWHPLIDNVIPVAIRRWRKSFAHNIFSKEFREFRQTLRNQEYDMVIDAQGLVKSALLTRLAKGTRSGLDRRCAREPLAALFYQRRYCVPVGMHAVTRTRHLFAQALGYTLPTIEADYGIDRSTLTPETSPQPYVVFVHGTTWQTKLWPQTYWIKLAELCGKAGLQVKLPWGNAEEHERAQHIATHNAHSDVLPRLNLQGVAKVLAGANAVVAVDSGIGHLSAALNTPTISLYGATDPKLTGTVGKQQIHLASDFSCAPCLQEVCSFRGERTIEPACFERVTPQRVMQKLQTLL